MGATNAHAAFIAMVTSFEIKWNKLYTKRCLLRTEPEWSWLGTQLDTAAATMKQEKTAAEHASAPG